MLAHCWAERTGVRQVSCSKGWEHLMTPAHIPTIFNLSRAAGHERGLGSSSQLSEKAKDLLLSSECQTWWGKAILWWWLFNDRDSWKVPPFFFETRWRSVGYWLQSNMQSKQHMDKPVRKDDHVSSFGYSWNSCWTGVSPFKPPRLWDAPHTESF